MTCVICDKRPAAEQGKCANCNSKIDSIKRKAGSPQPFKFLTYKGIVVGLYLNGKDTLTPKLLNRSPKYLPKGKTLDLNRYCQGFTREKIKEFKKVCLQLANS